MVEKLVLDNVNLIYSVLKQMNLYNQCDKYYDIGLIGLIKGAHTFDYRYGTKVSTHLGVCIKNEILQELRKEKTNKRRANYNKISLSEEVYISNDNNSITLEEMIADDVDIEKQLIEQEMLKCLYQEIEKLNGKEQFVLNHLYGLKGYEKLKQREIASVLNTTQGYVSRIKNIAIKKLRKRVNYE